MSSVSFSLNEVSEANKSVLKEKIKAHLKRGGLIWSLTKQSGR